MSDLSKVSPLLPPEWRFHALLSDTAHCHVGYWSTPDSPYTLAQAQDAWFAHVCAQLMPPPAKLLLIGHDTGAHAASLQAQGYQVSLLCPWSETAQVAIRAQYPALDVQTGTLSAPQTSLDALAPFDVIWMLESLQDYSELAPVFRQLRAWLTPPQGRLLLTEPVSYHAHTHKIAVVHEVNEIEFYWAAAGFFVRHHENLTAQTSPTYQQLQGAAQAAIDDLTRAELEPQVQHWQTQQQRIDKGQMGYELWLLETSDYQVHGYRGGDEQAILETFQKVFNVSRSEKHWHWKFLRNPFGGPYVSTVWDGALLVAHYTAYPVPLWRNGHSSVLTQQVADILTHPAYRGVGRGITSLLARAYRHFTRSYCEGHIPFFYGFLTGAHLGFGKLFLNYQPITEVLEWRLNTEAMAHYPTCLSISERLLGYRVEWTEEVGEWADLVFEQAREAYGWLTVRSSQYLRWRYQQNPDHRYHFFVVYKRNKPLGWWLARVENSVLKIGDALFVRQPQSLKAARLGLNMALCHLNRSGCEIRQIQGWFSQTPSWWVDILKALNFCPSPQPDGLTLCISPFSSPFSKATDLDVLREQWYFTQGDSDLF